MKPKKLRKIGKFGLQYFVVFILLFSLTLPSMLNLAPAKAYSWGSPTLLGPSSPIQPIFAPDFAVRPTDGLGFSVGESGSGTQGVPANALVVARGDQPSQFLCGNNCDDSPNPTSHKYAHVAFAPDGTGFIVYRYQSDSTNNYFRGWMKMMLPNGSFSSGIDVGGSYHTSGGAADLDFPDVAYSAAAGKLYLVGDVNTLPNAGVGFAESSNNGNSWQNITTLASATNQHGSNGFAHICVDNSDNVHVIYYAANSTQVMVQSRISGVWQSALAIPSPNWTLRGSSTIACGPHGEAYALWDSNGSFGLARYLPATGWQLLSMDAIAGTNIDQVAATVTPDSRLWVGAGYKAGDPASGVGTAIFVSNNQGASFSGPQTSISHSSATFGVGLGYSSSLDKLEGMATFVSRDSYYVEADGVGGLPPTPTPVPTATPTATATATPTNTPKPTATPTPTMTATSTNTPGATTGILTPATTPAVTSGSDTTTTPGATATIPAATLTPGFTVSPSPTVMTSPTTDTLTPIPMPTNTPMSLLPTLYPTSTPDERTVLAARQNLTAQAGAYYTNLTMTAAAIQSQKSTATALAASNAATATAAFVPTVAPTPTPAIIKRTTPTIQANTGAGGNSNNSGTGSSIGKVVNSGGFGNVPTSAAASGGTSPLTPAGPALAISVPVTNTFNATGAGSLVADSIDPQKASDAAKEAIMFALPTVTPVPTATPLPPTATPVPTATEQPMAGVAGAGSSSNASRVLYVAQPGAELAVQASLSAGNSPGDLLNQLTYRLIVSGLLALIVVGIWHKLTVTIKTERRHKA